MSFVGLKLNLYKSCRRTAGFEAVRVAEDPLEFGNLNSQSSVRILHAALNFVSSVIMISIATTIYIITIVLTSVSH